MKAKIIFRFILMILSIEANNCENVVASNNKTSPDKPQSPPVTSGRNETTVSALLEDIESYNETEPYIVYLPDFLESSENDDETDRTIATTTTITVTNEEATSVTTPPSHQETTFPATKMSQKVTTKILLSSQKQKDLVNKTNQAISTLLESVDQVVNQYYPQNFGFTVIPLKRRKRNATTNCNPKGPSCPEEGTFRLKKSCKKFYVCRFDEKCNKLLPEIYTCPKCLKFNAQKATCDLAENVPECSNSNTSPKEFCTGPGRFFVPDKCNQYYECTKNGTQIDLTVKTCPLANIFHRKQLKCVKGDNWKIGPKCTSSESYVADQFDCKKFYYCVTTTFSVALYCPPPYVYNGDKCEKFENSALQWDEEELRLKDIKK